MYSAQLSRKEPKKWDTIKGELVKIYALYFYIFVERNIKSTQKVHNTVDSKIELLVNTTEKQKRNNTIIIITIILKIHVLSSHIFIALGWMY